MNVKMKKLVMGLMISVGLVGSGCVKAANVVPADDECGRSPVKNKDEQAIYQAFKNAANLRTKAGLDATVALFKQHSNDLKHYIGLYDSKDKNVYPEGEEKLCAWRFAARNFNAQVLALFLPHLNEQAKILAVQDVAFFTVGGKDLDAQIETLKLLFLNNGQAAMDVAVKEIEKQGNSYATQFVKHYIDQFKKNPPILPWVRSVQALVANPKASSEDLSDIEGNFKQAFNEHTVLNWVQKNQKNAARLLRACAGEDDEKEWITMMSYIDALLHAGVDPLDDRVDDRATGKNALRNAISGGDNGKMFKLLMANVEQQKITKRITPEKYQATIDEMLVRAAAKDRVYIASVLLWKGANPTVKLNDPAAPKINGKTAVDIAKEKKSESLEPLFVMVNRRLAIAAEPIEDALRIKMLAEIFQVAIFFKSALVSWLAAIKNDLEIIKFVYNLRMIDYVSKDDDSQVLRRDPLELPLFDELKKRMPSDTGENDLRRAINDGDDGKKFKLLMDSVKQQHPEDFQVIIDKMLRCAAAKDRVYIASVLLWKGARPDVKLIDPEAPKINGKTAMQIAKELSQKTSLILTSLFAWNQAWKMQSVAGIKAAVETFGFVYSDGRSICDGWLDRIDRDPDLIRYCRSLFDTGADHQSRAPLYFKLNALLGDAHPLSAARGAPDEVKFPAPAPAPLPVPSAPAPEEEVQMPQVQAQEGTWECPVCTLMNKPNFLQCSACGAVRSQGAEHKKVEERPAPAPKPDQKWACPACTFDNKAEANVCEICGAARPPAVKQQSRPVEKKKAEEVKAPEAAEVIQKPADRKRVAGQSDWTCELCGTQNGKIYDSCGKCWLIKEKGKALVGNLYNYFVQMVAKGQKAAADKTIEAWINIQFDNEDEARRCPICNSRFARGANDGAIHGAGVPLYLLQCGHVFHVSCLTDAEKAFKPSKEYPTFVCPTCRGTTAGKITFTIKGVGERHSDYARRQ